MQLLKIMAAARGLELLSYVAKLAQYLILYRPEALEIANTVPTLKQCLDLAGLVTLHQKEYQEDKNFFIGKIRVTNLPKL